jgi:hypothetical protein
MTHHPTVLGNPGAQYKLWELIDFLTASAYLIALRDLKHQ